MLRYARSTEISTAELTGALQGASRGTPADRAGHPRRRRPPAARKDG
jgi:hypothetical protein